jgi:hypothetical protein
VRAALLKSIEYRETPDARRDLRQASFVQRCAVAGTYPRRFAE